MHSLRMLATAPGRLALQPLFLLGLLTTGVAAHAETRAFDKTFPVTSGGTLVVDTDTGSVNVTGTDAKQVVISVSLRGSRSRLDDFQLTADATESGVEVRGRRDRDSWFPLSWMMGDTLSVAYTIHVPRDYHIQARTAGGDLELRNLNGKVLMRTSGGDVRVNDFSGDAELRTSGGNIRALQLTGNLKFVTSGGNITVTDARGDVSAHTSGGNIRMQATDSRIKAGTSGGDIDVSLVGGNRGVDVHTSGGDITVKVPGDFKAQVTARTSGGDVECDLPVTSVGVHKRHSLSGTINGGGELLQARTSGGDIRIETASL